MDGTRRQQTTHTTDNRRSLGAQQCMCWRGWQAGWMDGCLTGWMAIEKTIPIALLSLPLPLLLVTVGR